MLFGHHGLLWMYIVTQLNLGGHMLGKNRREMVTFTRNIKCQEDNSFSYITQDWSRFCQHTQKSHHNIFLWEIGRDPRLLHRSQCVFKTVICCLNLWFLPGRELTWTSYISKGNKTKNHSCASEWWITRSLLLRWCHFSEKDQWGMSFPLITLFIPIFNCVESQLVYGWVF